jgi:K+-transporting ATPase ATPase A chain
MATTATTVFHRPACTTGIAVAYALIRGFSFALCKCDRQLLGRPYAQHPLGPAAVVAAVLPVADRARRDSEFLRYKEVALVELFTCTVPMKGQDGQPVLNAQGAAVTETVVAKPQILAMAGRTAGSH